MPVDAAAILFAVLASLALAFQIALACGAPWGEFTLGGKYRGRLPPAVRGVALASGIVIAGFAAIVLARAGLAFAGMAAASRWMIWLVVGYCALGSVANALTPSRRERALWLPVLLLMLGTGIAVGMG